MMVRAWLASTFWDDSDEEMMISDAKMMISPLKPYMIPNLADIRMVVVYILRVLCGPSPCCPSTS